MKQPVNFRQIILKFVLLFLSASAFAQQGIIRGTIIDNATGEKLFGAAVQIKGTDKGVITDLEGSFELKVEPGTYDIQISFVSFENLIIEGVKVNPGQVVVLGQVRLKESVSTLEAVVITADALKNSESAILTVKRKSPNLLDGISAQNFQKVGDGDAAAAAKRVVGVSVEGGKYVYVRGLGDRYTKSTLNGMDIPGLDPDRNTIQMDLFPTSILDNIVVTKSFSADLPADFTGGIVNLETKDFPEDKVRSISVSTGFVPSMHFNSNYLTYEGGGADFLGFDDGTRRIPTGGSTNIPFVGDALGGGQSRDRFESILRGFNSTLAARRTTSFMDYGLGFTLGNQVPWGKYTAGYSVGFTYKYNTEYYESAEFNRYIKEDRNDTELTAAQSQNGDYGTSEVLMAGMFGLALKTQQTKYKINLLHIQNGQSKAGIFDYANAYRGANWDGFQHNLEFNQRSLTNLLLAGTHYLNNTRWQLNWSLSPTRSAISDPDIRQTRFRVDDGALTIGTESGLPERIWRSLEEYNVATKVDVVKEYDALGNAAKLRFGVANTLKYREFNIQDFQFIIGNDVDITGNPNDLLTQENLWSSSNNGGIYYSPNFLPRNINFFQSTANNAAGYISTEVSPLDRLRAIFGIRVEKYVQFYTGEGNDANGIVSLNNEVVIDDLDLFPSVNLVYNLTESQNIRVSYSNTIARPSFREASFANIKDPLTGRTFIGGFYTDVDAGGGSNDLVWDGNLRSTRINNFDVRWEVFQRNGQTISVGGFYKYFDSPIEIVQYIQAYNNFQSRNVGNGQVVGAEFELRQSFGRISNALDNFFLTGNVTITKSQIDMTQSEYDARVRFAADNQEIKSTRAMAGQAPMMMNLGMAYSGNGNGFDAGLYYNVQAETLHIVGIGENPDVYSVPFHSLNFNANKAFGNENKMRMGLGIANILGQEREFVFRSFEGKDQTFSKLNPGTRISLSYTYSF
jgi:hypothetical protein